MGYLDKQSRVIDIVLTERGRKLYALGQLDFTFFGLFDDGIDYDPWYSGTLSDDDRELQIEGTPMIEAPVVRDVLGTTAPLEPINHIFTAAGAYTVLPRMTSPSTGDRIELEADQRPSTVVIGGARTSYTRTGGNTAQITLDVQGGVQRGNPGFIVRVLSSGTNGLKPLDVRRDLGGRRAFDPFVAVAVDSEPVVDQPSVSNPNSSRVSSATDGRGS